MFWKEIHHFDQLLTLKINSWNCNVTDPIWQFFSNIPVWIPMYVLIVALLIWRLGWKKGLIMTLAAAATFGFCDQFSNPGGKSPRILIRDNNVHVYVWNLNELHSFDRSGKKIESFLTEDDFDKSTSFPGWTIKWSDLTYSFENYVYTIKLETIALSATKLTVSDGKQVKTLFSTSK